MTRKPWYIAENGDTPMELLLRLIVWCAWWAAIPYRIAIMAITLWEVFIVMGGSLAGGLMAFAAFGIHVLILLRCSPRTTPDWRYLIEVLMFGMAVYKIEYSGGLLAVAILIPLFGLYIYNFLRYFGAEDRLD